MIVEDPEFIEMMKTGRPSHVIPDRRRVSKDVITAWQGSRKKLRRKLSVSLSGRELSSNLLHYRLSRAD